MTRPGDATQQNGFTLVEMLVALVIFAMLSAAGTALLAFSIDARRQTSARLDGLADITRLRALLTADLGQAAPRPWRDGAGQRQMAFAGDVATLQLVRRGWANDGGAPRSSLQRVTWRLAGDRLERISAPMVDGGATNPPAVLATGVTQWRLRFYSGGEWRDVWQPLARTDLPQAVEVTLATHIMPELRQIILVGPA